MPINRLSILSPKEANALADTTRVAILHAICHYPMSADEIASVLESMGQKRSTTTIRHHLEILKGAGLIDISRMVENRGTVMKYYSPRLHPYDAELVEPLPTVAERLVEDLSRKLVRILESISGDKKFGSIEIQKTHCKVCKNDHSRIALVLSIFEAALAKAALNCNLADKPRTAK